MAWYDRLTNLGIEESTSSEMVVNLKTANIINLAFLVVFVSLGILFALIAPALLVVVLAGFFLTGLSILLQYNHLSKASRVITGCSVSTIAVFFYLMVIGEDGSSDTLLFSALSMIAFFPFFVFGADESPYTFFSFSWNVLLIMVCENWLAELSWGSGYPDVRNTIILNLLFLTAAICVGGAAYSIKYANKIESDKGAQLLRERNQEKSEVQDRELRLKEMLNKLENAQRDEEKRMWSSKGLAEIGKILREMKDEQQVADQLIAFLVKYLDANQGAIFTLLNNEHFIMRSCYAYERKKHVDKKINVGEGIIGQCYYEKTYTYITQVPANYIHITSGLGYATPRALLVIPLIANDQVQGAMEFASFAEFEKHQIDFLMDAGENMAIALLDIAVNERTKELLNETQNMAEQMRTQEEEMRQNMEELAATQEQQSRIENELRAALQEKEAMIDELKRKSNNKNLAFK
jgi:putative methionine-R-sulfoxide reductase with GAF domain